jgi:hypothetical protein
MAHTLPSPAVRAGARRAGRPAVGGSTAAAGAAPRRAPVAAAPTRLARLHPPAAEPVGGEGAEPTTTTAPRDDDVRCEDEEMEAQPICARRSSNPTLIHPNPNKKKSTQQVLPDSLLDALVQASEATHRAIQDGAGRTLVELLLPEFWDPNSGAVFAESGDQQRFWKLTRRFADELASCAGSPRILALYPDAGVAAMLKNQWPDAGFDIAALGDPRARAGLSPDGGAEVALLAAPDPPALASASAAASAAAAAGIPLVMFNPRLVSGDVGIGLNVRRLREDFLSSFTVTYALRPVGDVGTVFRRYPAPWQVFAADPASPGRYLLVAERGSPPAGEALDRIFEEAMGGGGGSGGGDGKDGGDGSGGGGNNGGGGPGGVLASLGSTVRSLQRFMRQLSQ